MDSHMNILIRDQVYRCRHALINGYGHTDNESEQNIKQATIIILNKIEPWIDINAIAVRVFEEMVSLITDLMSHKGSFEEYENEIKKIAKHASYQSFKSATTPESLLEKIDWESVEDIFKKGLD